jgi:flagellin-specific chaperone FliS
MNPMIDKTWTVMNDLQESFNQITHFDFLIEKLNEAVNANDQQKIVDISAALTAFYPVYISDFDDKFKTAWDHVVKGQ